MYQICSIGGIHSTFEEFRKSSSLDNNGIIITDRFFGFDFDLFGSKYDYDIVEPETSENFTISQTIINPDGNQVTIYKEKYPNKSDAEVVSKKSEEIDNKIKLRKRKEPPPDINTNTKFSKQKFVTPTSNKLKFFIPTKNKEKKLWSKKEDNRLIKYVLNSPNIDFEEIAKHFESRTGNGCRNRYTKLLQKMKDYC